MVAVLVVESHCPEQMALIFPRKAVDRHPWKPYLCLVVLGNLILVEGQDDQYAPFSIWRSQAILKTDAPMISLAGFYSGCSSCICRLWMLLGICHSPLLRRCTLATQQKGWLVGFKSKHSVTCLASAAPITGNQSIPTSILPRRLCGEIEVLVVLGVFIVADSTKHVLRKASKSYSLPLVINNLTT